MIGCTSFERHIVSSDLKSPLERLAGEPQPHQFIDVAANFTEIMTSCQWLYVDITHESQLSEEVWESIKTLLSQHNHVTLYTLDFKFDPGFLSHPRYQELALYPLRYIEERTPTFAGIEWMPDGSENGVMVVSTYSFRPVLISGA